MTVLNTSYSTIDEAWGEAYLSPSLQQKKKKKRSTEGAKAAAQSDPICDLYAMGNNNYNEDDIVSYANQYFEKHDKSSWQQPMMRNREPPKMVELKDGGVYAYGAPFEHDDTPLAPEVPRRSSTPPLTFHDPDEDASMDNEPPRRVTSAPPAPRVQYEDADPLPYSRSQRRLVDTHEYYVDDPYYNKRDKAFNWMDIALYIISGIILIFMMEQFVKIGLLLQSA